MMKLLLRLLIALVGVHQGASFSVLSPASASSSTSLFMADNTAERTTKRAISVPLTLDEMVRQASSAVKEAADQGMTRQIVRVLLPRDATYGDFGKALESSSEIDTSLVPPDESWQGGIMQLYRAAAPTGQAIVQRVTSSAGLPPRITEDRSVDESGVDGVGLLQTDDRSVTTWVQPTQENVDGIEETAEKAADDQIVILLNPQWRQVDDALDSASKGEGFLSNFASFLGGKGGTLKRMQEAGFKPVYSLEGYVCRGANVRILQVLDSEWSIFCERDDAESFIPVGTTPDRPTYQEVDELLQKADIGFKFSRDIGMEPKL